MDKSRCKFWARTISDCLPGSQDKFRPSKDVSTWILTKLDALNLSFCNSDKFRCSKLVFLKKETNSEFWIWPFSGGTNLDGLNLSFLQNDWFRWSKFVLLAWRTNFDGLNLSFLMWDKLRCSEFVPFPSSTNLGALNLSLWQAGQI